MHRWNRSDYYWIVQSEKRGKKEKEIFQLIRLNNNKYYSAWIKSRFFWSKNRNFLFFRIVIISHKKIWNFLQAGFSDDFIALIFLSFVVKLTSNTIQWMDWSHKWWHDLFQRNIVQRLFNIVEWTLDPLCWRVVDVRCIQNHSTFLRKNVRVYTCNWRLQACNAP